MNDDTVHSAGDEPEVDEPGGLDRRSMLAKTGAAAAVAAAAWTAPSISGLSVVPDYAAAGTSTNTTITFDVNVEGPGNAGGTNAFNAVSNPAWTINSGGPSNNAPIQYTAPLGAAGNAVFLLPQGEPADGNPVDGTVTFIVDPPYNRARVTGGTFGPVTPAFFGNLPGGNLAIGANVSPNNTSPIVVPWSLPDQPGNAVRVNDINVTITTT
ncbi:hypothetical protein [Dermatobacter hominis]|uniref:hypothetical protein n=1 Tax=Dermatobacter hominis TaxID=2884263 RepID=UPI001D10625A|nr:hypothetical protein [Dermatobacter hominis]UDY33950.1 hypothetical protein LH044_11390 [Dermatobacter hominis]